MMRMMMTMMMVIITQMIVILRMMMMMVVKMKVVGNFFRYIFTCKRNSDGSEASQLDFHTFNALPMHCTLFAL